MGEQSLMKPQKPAMRQSNFELLRILFMIMVVATHLRSFGGLLQLEEQNIFSKLLLLFLGWGGKTGVNGFVLLSGYFLCTSKKGLQPMRLLKLCLQILFYSIGGYLLALATDLAQFSWEKTFLYFMPLSNRIFWFATVYMLLMLLSPYLNMVIQKLEKRQYQRLLLLLFGVLSLLPSLLRIEYETPELLWFVMLYFLAGYLRLHPARWMEKKWLALAVAATSYLFVAYYATAFEYLSPLLGDFADILPDKLSLEHQVPVLLCALGLFLFFKNLNIKGSRFINALAGAMFGVYLCHEHRLWRETLWQDWFDCRDVYAAPRRFAGQALWAIAGVFFISLSIELIRLYALEKPLFRLIDHLQQRKKGSHE